MGWNASASVAKSAPNEVIAAAAAGCLHRAEEEEREGESCSDFVFENPPRDISHP